MADHQHAPTEASSANPVLIEAVRGDAVESIHRGSFAIVDAHGRVIMAAGDTDTPGVSPIGHQTHPGLGPDRNGAAKAFGTGTCQYRSRLCQP